MFYSASFGFTSEKIDDLIDLIIKQNEEKAKQTQREKESKESVQNFSKVETAEDKSTSMVHTERLGNLPNSSIEIVRPEISTSESSQTSDLESLENPETEKLQTQSEALEDQTEDVPEDRLQKIERELFEELDDLKSNKPLSLYEQTMRGSKELAVFNAFKNIIEKHQLSEEDHLSLLKAYFSSEKLNLMDFFKALSQPLLFGVKYSTQLSRVLKEVILLRINRSKVEDDKKWDGFSSLLLHHLNTLLIEHKDKLEIAFAIIKRIPSYFVYRISPGENQIKFEKEDYPLLIDNLFQKFDEIKDLDLLKSLLNFINEHDLSVEDMADWIKSCIGPDTEYIIQKFIVDLKDGNIKYGLISNLLNDLLNLPDVGPGAVKFMLRLIEQSRMIERLDQEILNQIIDLCIQTEVSNPEFKNFISAIPNEKLRLAAKEYHAAKKNQLKEFLSDPGEKIEH
ncbi:MAG: hypothetical protein HWD61_02405 [Parachlamydiaceae bacterium]|nr:MAG: hypothetical protein HWD61_02405 [Parachlamydiaceae bacterium]